MLFDYVKEYGSMAFSKEPMNYLDLLVFTGLGYLDYPSECIGKRLPEALEYATAPTIPSEDGKHKVVAMETEDDEKLANLAMQAERYKNVQVVDFASNYLEDFQQFAALCLGLGDLVIAIFRGTDETVTGWREALELSLERPVGAQIDAGDFLEKQARRTDGPIIACGHSKGGNLAEYSALSLVRNDPSAAARIAEIVSFDGPGLPPILRSTAAYKMLEDRIKVFIPKSSIVGNIHDHPKGSVVFIDSDKPFLMQHLIYNWRTDGSRFIKKRQSLAGKTGSAALSSLIDNLDDKQKGRIFDILFALPKASGKRFLTDR